MPEPRSARFGQYRSMPEPRRAALVPAYSQWEDGVSQAAAPDSTTDAAPLLAETAIDQHAPSLRYLHAFAQIFDNPHWAQNILLATVCQLIPIAGYLVICGYTYENIEALHRKPRWTYPNFEFSRFGEYLSRGVWPGLIALLLSLVVFPALYVAFYMAAVALTVGAVVSGREFTVLTLSIGIPLLLLLACAIGLAIVYFLRPLLLLAGLSQDLGVAFRLTWIGDFLRKVWVELLLATLFGAVTLVILYLLGTLFFVVGIYPAVTIWQLATAHLDYQLYQLYLSRGGKPIRLKPPPRYFAQVW